MTSVGGVNGAAARTAVRRSMNRPLPAAVSGRCGFDRTADSAVIGPAVTRQQATRLGAGGLPAAATTSAGPPSGHTRTRLSRASYAAQTPTDATATGAANSRPNALSSRYVAVEPTLSEAGRASMTILGAKNDGPAIAGASRSAICRSVGGHEPSVFMTVTRSSHIGGLPGEGGRVALECPVHSRFKPR